MDRPFEPYRPQTLRQYVASYNGLSTTASATISRVTKTTATRGEITNPDGRRAPNKIEPWTQAETDVERAIIDTILQEMDNEHGHGAGAGAGADETPLRFPERQHVVRVGEDLVRVDSEHALLLYDSDTLHKPASRILRSLLDVERIRRAVSEAIERCGRTKHKRIRPGQVSFPTHRNRVPSRPAIKRKRDDTLDHTSATASPLRRSGPADVFCIFEPQRSRAGGPSTAGVSSTAPELLFVKEAKAPHKFTSEIIDKAVGRGDRVLDSNAIMSRGFPGAQSDSDELGVGESEYWFAAVCAQLYTSMIDDDCLRYGVITTGTNYIFVSIDPDSPSIMRYSVSKNPTGIESSPLLRIVALALLGMHGSTLPHQPALDIISRRQGLIWTTGRENASFYDDGVPAQTPGTESWREPSGQRSDGGSVSTDERTRRAGPQAEAQGLSYPSPPPQGGSSTLGKHRRHDDDLPGDEPEAAPMKHPRLVGTENVEDTTLSEPQHRPTTPTSSPLASPASPEPISINNVQYCSVACLLAVKCRDITRPPCPNYNEHVRPASPVTEAGQLRESLKDQLIRGEGERDHTFFWWKPGSGYAQPVKIWLKSHGYVLFAKAFQPDDIPKMRREAQIYDRLRALQGFHIPVCLGTIEIPVERSLLCSGVDFTGLLLLSHAGYGIDDWPHLGLDLGQGSGADRAFAQSLASEAQRTLASIHERGVLHRDVALRNILLQKINRQGPTSNPTFEIQLQIIDFERSRTRADYRRNAQHVHALKGNQEGDTERSTQDIGNEDFAKACAKEIESCARVMSKWYTP